ncbi:regulatory protein GemA [Methylocystis sp. WRRC1]|uniref:regulatory protein GemA n=1 Tax=unclassified Methylocystis TaxID=2625913 RepID=UPI0001F8684B|nr:MULTISPECIES: regulatory protein GemA [unclassified Methylocystis]MCC3246171.1 regulatory protein GemA [Methylocystis sp. WRRC1]
MTTAAQTRAIHSLRKQVAHFTDDDYRALLRDNFSVSSSSLLSERQAAKLIDMLKVLAGSHARVRRASDTASGPYAGKLRALWISAWNLGLVRSRDDKALIAFVERQTKLSHTRFLTEPADAMKAIEALKSMVSRGAKIDWPETDSPADIKKAVAMAVAARCIETGCFRPFIREGQNNTVDANLERYGYAVGNPASFEFYTGEHWDKLASALGKRLRVRLEAMKKEAA